MPTKDESIRIRWSANKQFKKYEISFRNLILTDKRLQGHLRNPSYVFRTGLIPYYNQIRRFEKSSGNKSKFSLPEIPELGKAEGFRMESTLYFPKWFNKHIKEMDSNLKGDYRFKPQDRSRTKLIIRFILWYIKLRTKEEERGVYTPFKYFDDNELKAMYK